MPMNRSWRQADPQVYKIMQGELERQKTTLMLIPSENYASRAVMAAMGSVFTNKYAEGYPYNRYYHGCEFYDDLEQLAIDRANDLFGSDHANVQLHTGSQANMAAYYALLEPGDRIMALTVATGGHLTHGSPISFSGQLYESHFYSLDPETDRLNYDMILEQVKKVQPRLIIAGYSAYPRIIDFRKFREIADEVGAYLMADIAHICGLVAAEAHPTPVPYADIVTSTTHKTLRGPRGALILCKQQYAEQIDRAVFPGIQAGPLMQIIRNCQALGQALQDEGFTLVTGGTDNHLLLVDLRNKDITGRETADLLEAAGIVVNKNLIPGDPASATETSGIRPGTPGLTSRGMKEPEMKIVGQWMARTVHEGRANPEVLEEIRGEVRELCEAFPIYEDL